MFSYHGKIALVTLAFLTIAAIYLFTPGQNATVPGAVLDIGLEHAQPMTLSVSLTEGTRRSLIDMDTASTESSYLTVPEGWHRSEVRHAPIASVTAEDKDGSMKRWTLPKNAGVSFSTDEPFRTLKIHNPSGVPVKIQLTRVNLAKKTSSYDVYLLKDGALVLP